MPFISGGGGGGAFTGGRLTSQLELANAANTPPLVIDGGAAHGADQLTVASQASPAFIVEVFNNGGAQITSDAAASPALYLASTKAAQTADILSVEEPVGNAVVGGFDKGGYLYTKLHAAPADGALVAGQLMLWFDQTNGAAKLMVKAKQADGTVKTASIALA